MKPLNRINGRIGLYNIDGQNIDDSIINAGYVGSKRDMDILWAAVRDMIKSLCALPICKIKMEIDLDRKIWFTDIDKESSRYADDILCDWMYHGKPTAISLHDIITAYTSKIYATYSLIPNRRISRHDLKSSVEYGTAPSSIWPPNPPVPYIKDEGHKTEPDCLLHPLITNHLPNCTMVKDGCIHGPKPHDVYCGWNSEKPSKSFIKNHALQRTSLVQKEKNITIKRMIECLNVDCAFVLSDSLRHSVLLANKKPDITKIYDHINMIGDKFGTPVDCLMVSNDAMNDLLMDKSSNDAKRIMCGERIIGDGSKPIDVKKPPRPGWFTEYNMLYNMDRFGFEMISNVHKTDTFDIRVEYVIANAYMMGDPRWYISGVAVMLCNADINWYLLLYLSSVYGFGNTLMGLLQELNSSGKSFNTPLHMLTAAGAFPLQTEKDTVTDVLDTYNCR